ncbi:hypothetical protein [Streptomyces sp. P17]|uniref:hypothetical protein n=1 Tax=Streptomyces sp. P17 TaxID=3074716 RepID=UPI0028F441A9|nr:hypothetical protein [Streptomyces sp. P17]MDT9696113.1 hypothetical protein [Streptomyces sp. P17]
MDVYEDPSTWVPEPVRSRWQLALRFVGSVLFLPVFCVFWLAAAVVLSFVDVAEVALAQRWELRPTAVRKEVRLWWSAASHVDSVNTA